MASRLAEIYRSEKKTGGGLGSSIGKSLKEKIDPRRMLDQSGLLVSMFPSLKSFNATRSKGVAEKVSGNVGGGIDNSVLNTLAATSSLSAKNSMVLPMMARDMNLMKLNMFKLVKLQGGSANTTKTDMFWKNAKGRESAYESVIGKMMGGGKFGGMAKGLMSAGKQRDGQSPETALYVTGGTGGDETSLIGGIVGSMGKSATLAKLVTVASSVVASPLFLASAGLATLALAKKLRDDEIASDPKKYKDVPSERAKREGTTNKTAGARNAAEARTGLQTLTKGTADDILNYLTTGKIVGQPATDNAIDGIVKGAKIADVLAVASDSAKTPYLKMVADNTPKQPTPTKLEIDTQAAAERLKNLPDTGAGGGRGFINPTLVTPEAETIPSNVVRSGDGTPIMTGSGGYVTSGEAAPMKPSPVAAGATTSQTTSPTPVKNPLLDMIAKGESGAAGYNAMNQGTPGGGPVIGSGNSQKIINKKLTDMTVGEILDKGTKPKDDEKTRREKGLIFAAGRYQIIPDTLKALVKQGVVSRDDKFDEATQDKLGMALIRGTGALKDAAAGNYEEAQNKLAKVWAAIPLATDVDDKKAGQSFYQKPGQNKSMQNLDVKSALMQTSPSTGSVVATASTTVADGRRSGTQAGAGTIINSPTTNTTVAAAGGSNSGSGVKLYNDALRVDSLRMVI